MNDIGNRIRQIREIKGFSQESIALELGLTQPSYARLEKDDKRLDIVRLIQIANFLKTTVSELIDEKTHKVINQQNSKHPNAYVDSIINTDKSHIESLKEEITFLRKLLEEKNNQ